MGAVSDGLKLFAVSVLPAMFPFFFFSKLLTSLGAAESLSSLTKKPTALLFNAPEVGGYVFAMSLLCGYPIGAKMVADCYESGLCSQSGAKKLIAFTSTSGPLFVLGTVGLSMFNNYTVGVVILISHYIAAVINGLIFRGKKALDNTPLPLIPKQKDSALAEAINSSIFSVAAVGGYIAIFNMAITALKDLELLNIISLFLLKINIPYNVSEGIVSGIIEVTRGALVLSTSGSALVITVPIAAMLVSFGGLSVTLQSLTFLSKCKIKASYYLLTKITHALVTAVIALGLSLILFR